METQNLQEIFVHYLPFIIGLVAWDIVWKLIAMWSAARNNHRTWFVCIALVNSIGILPMVYLYNQRKKAK